MDEEAGGPGDRRSTINDCWNRIGVRGDGSCPELEQYAHCRNCPVYSAAALTLLDRELPAGYAGRMDRPFRRTQEARRSRILHSAIIFRIGAEWFALPTLALDEVAELRTIHSLPHRRSGVVLGLVNVRGELSDLRLAQPRCWAWEKRPRSMPSANASTPSAWWSSATTAAEWRSRSTRCSASIATIRAT